MDYIISRAEEGDTIKKNVLKCYFESDATESAKKIGISHGKIIGSEFIYSKSIVFPPQDCELFTWARYPKYRNKHFQKKLPETYSVHAIISPSKIL